MIVTRGLTKRYGRHAGRRRPELHRLPRRRHRVPRPERFGEIHHHAHDPRPRQARRGVGARQRLRLRRAVVAACARSGALLDAKAFHPGRSARNHLRWLAQTNDIPPARVDAVLDIVGLTAVADRRAGKFSLGMGQRLGIASALLGDPGVLLFDEPVNGLDPEGIRWVRHLLRDLASEGRTVLVSSHLINEMALTAERLVVIGRGTLIAETSVDDFVARHQSDAVRIVTPTPQRFVAALSRAGARPVRRDGRGHRRLRPVLRRHRRAGRRSGAHRARAHPAARLARGRLHGAHERLRRVPLAHRRRRPARPTRCRLAERNDR